MAYLPNNWVDQNVERPKTYNFTQNDDGSTTLIDAFGNVTELGTPVNADYMNHIEQGISGCAVRKYSQTETYSAGEWVQGKIDNKQGIYESLADNNIANPLTDLTNWKELDFASKSGGSGYSMFDIIQSDRILSYEESKGKALLGSWVHKTAVPAERYGYPDFYAKCVNEMNEGIQTEVTLGASVVTMYVHANGHAFYDAADKAVIDAWYDTYGYAWYYCIDKENERVFLPRNDWFFQSGSSVDVNKFVEAGLPNITGTVKSGANGGDYMGGAFYYLNSNTAGVSGRHDGGSDANYSAGTAGFSASRSSGVYGKSSTVQPNSVKQLFYMVVGNTETQSSLIDVVDITTSENDTLPLYFNTYSNTDLTTTGAFVDASLGLYLSGNLYTTAYNDLVNKIGQSFCAGVIKEYGDSTITDYDCVVNQTDMTFKLPLLNGSETKGSGSLYFKLCNALQNRQLIDCAEVLNELKQRTTPAQAASATLPSSRYTNLTVGASGTQYTMPADGWLACMGVSTANWGWIDMTTYQSIYGVNPNNITTGSTKAIMPIRKGEKVTITYGSVTSVSIRFIYAEGVQ